MVLVCQLQLFKEKAHMAPTTHALVTFHLDYHNVLYMGVTLKIVWKLQFLHNAAG